MMDGLTLRQSALGLDQCGRGRLGRLRLCRIEPADRQAHGCRGPDADIAVG
jgi:hypothetical protein